MLAICIGCLSPAQGRLIGYVLAPCKDRRELRLLDESISAGHVIEQHGPARRTSFRHDYLPEGDLPF
jgi:hypothetical protein